MGFRRPVIGCQLSAVSRQLRNAARGGLLLLIFVTSPVSRVSAHEGPPFPIIVDERVGPYVVSVWTDPDIGVGTFFVVIEPPDGAELVPVNSVSVGVVPTSGRLAEAVYEAEPQNVRYGARYYTEVAFDQGEFWNVRIRIDGAEGGGELTSEVEATPDGTIGPISLVLYLLPFLAVGFLWLKAMRRQRQHKAALAEERERTVS